MKVKMKVSEVLECLRRNRSQHRGIFKDACDGYKAQFIEKLNKAVDALKAGELSTPSLYMVAPDDHTDDYDYAIKMLEMTTQDEIELTEKDVAQYVMDDWGWKKQWDETVTSYSH